MANIWLHVQNYLLHFSLNFNFEISSNFRQLLSNNKWCHPPYRTRTRYLRISSFLQSSALPTELSAVVCLSAALICSTAIVWSFFIWKPWLRREENRQKSSLVVFMIQWEKFDFFALYNHIVKLMANIWLHMQNYLLHFSLNFNIEK